ncbi:MAG: redoxin domain-containing protein [Parcubacteria group bacterium]|nr:redoxin domain-containing protein [Parcubacteria group bacterium]
MNESALKRLPALQGSVWLGEKPESLDDFSDKVVLVVFWTYSSASCLRILPLLREWYERYQDENFTIIGIHAPEFEFEQNPKNVESAMRALGIPWSVLLDNDRLNWDSFENMYWPALYLVNQHKTIVHSHFGEEGCQNVEGRIREALGLDQEVFSGEREMREAYSLATSDTYCGYLRGKIGNDLGFAEEAEDEYKNDGAPEEGEIVLSGAFFSAPEYVESREEGASISVRFYAKEIDMVLAPDGGRALIEVLIDDFPLEEGVRGESVDGEGRVLLDRAGSYTMVKSKEYIKGVITFRAREGNFRAYVFTFL